MQNDVVILIAEDDHGHAGLIRINLKRAGIDNEIIHFTDGETLVNFLTMKGNGPQRKPDTAYLLLLDIRMPKVDGIDVLKMVKRSEQFKAIPVLILTTTDDPEEVKICHELGCSNYITKPIEYNKFIDTLKSLGLFLRIVDIPVIG